MTEQERLKEIKALLVERDKYANVDGETDYSNYDKYINILNDDGHIDWLVEWIQVLETSRSEIAESFRKTWSENQRYKKALESIKKPSPENDSVYILSQIALKALTGDTNG